MRAALTRLSLVASLILLAPAALQAEGRVRIDPGFGSNPGYSGQGLQPRTHRYIAPAPVRPRIVCDNFGRCFQRSPSTGYVRPPGWAYDSPYRTRVPGRFFRPDDNVVCDQGTRICYKNGRIDKTETRDAFGERAADRADDIRDDRGKARLFVPERGVTCDPVRQACYDDGFKDYSLTRRYFGQRAADRLF